MFHKLGTVCIERHVQHSKACLKSITAIKMSINSEAPNQECCNNSDNINRNNDSKCTSHLVVVQWPPQAVPACQSNTLLLGVDVKLQLGGLALLCPLCRSVAMDVNVAIC
jgi:hypothetical protein